MLQLRALQQHLHHKEQRSIAGSNTGGSNINAVRMYVGDAVYSRLSNRVDNVKDKMQCADALLT